MSLTYIAEIDLKTDCFAAACEAVAAIVEVTRAEAGCERFDPHPAADGSARLYIYERWTDRSAFDHHHAQNYTRSVFEKYDGWLSAPMRLTELADGLA